MPAFSLDVSTATVILSTSVAWLALFLTYRTYKRKSGLRLRGAYVITSSVECNDDFVSRVVIENLKDRAVTIFAIYLRLGYNVYVLIEDFGDQPFVLKPYETYQQDFDPIEFYGVNGRRIEIDDLLKNKKVKQRLVLSTGDGKYTVRKFLRPWDPVHVFFRNYMTAVIRPIRSTFKGKAYGRNTIFLVELKLPNDGEQLIPLRPEDYRIKRFRNVRLTKESLESKKALEGFLEGERQAGRLMAKSLIVHDLEAMRDEQFDPYKGPPLIAGAAGVISYYFGGWISTRLSNRKMRKENKKRAKIRLLAAQKK